MGKTKNTISYLNVQAKQKSGHISNNLSTVSKSVIEEREIL
jgi:hypothetical protein